MKTTETFIVGNNMQIKYHVFSIRYQQILSKPVSFRTLYSRFYTYINPLEETHGLASFGGNRLEVTHVIFTCITIMV